MDLTVVKIAVDGMDLDDPNPEFIEGDPGEFLLSNTKYHDCDLTVGNPKTDDVEKIGVSSTQLIAHSPVFRDMLADSELADPSGSNTHINDVSPATFKLMLRHVYGGKLPKMTPEEAAQLVLCADKYNIQRLVGKAAKRLKPTSSEDVFPALMCVAYINCPDLELPVTKIIQQETKQILQNPNFLELDGNCILFIVKQSILNISELELWNNLVRWSESQVQKYPEKSRRGCLSKVLPYVRLLLLTLEEITKHVLPFKILSADEFMDLTLAITNHQTIQSPALCNFQEKRLIYSDVKTKYFSDDVSHFNKEFVFKPEKTRAQTTLYETGPGKYSTLTIEPTKNIKIDSFVLKCYNTKKSNENYPISIDVTCTILIYTFKNGLQERFCSVTLKGGAAQNETVTLPVRKDNGQPLILEAGKKHALRISVTPLLPTHTIYIGSYRSANERFDDGHGMSVTYEDLFHIREIAYRVKE